MINYLRERRRTQAIGTLGVLDMPHEPGFDRFVEQAATAFAAPISLLNVISGDRLWVKASAGIELQCLPRRDGFCHHALDRPDPLEVCDALADPAFRHLPPVIGELGIRYYIGAPLKLADGTDIGALCVLDTRARAPASPDQRAYLVGLARQAARALERHAHRLGAPA